MKCQYNMPVLHLIKFNRNIEVMKEMRSGALVTTLIVCHISTTNADLYGTKEYDFTS